MSLDCHVLMFVTTMRPEGVDIPECALTCAASIVLAFFFVFVSSDLVVERAATD